jgi:hypothetical protein
VYARIRSPCAGHADHFITRFSERFLQFILYAARIGLTLKAMKIRPVISYCRAQPHVIKDL